MGKFGAPRSAGVEPWNRGVILSSFTTHRADATVAGRAILGIARHLCDLCAQRRVTRLWLSMPARHAVDVSARLAATRFKGGHHTVARHIRTWHHGADVHSTVSAVAND